MAISVNTISKGKCYVTENKQVRRVLDVTPDTVIYEARGRKLVASPWGPKMTVSKDKFAEDVKGEVDCNHEPA